MSKIKSSLLVSRMWTFLLQCRFFRSDNYLYIVRDALVALSRCVQPCVIVWCTSTRNVMLPCMPCVLCADWMSSARPVQRHVRRTTLPLPTRGAHRRAIRMSHFLQTTLLVWILPFFLYYSFIILFALLLHLVHISSSLLSLSPLLLAFLLLFSLFSL